MCEWQYVKLGDVCTKGGSNIAQKDLENNSGNYPIYGASGFIKNVDFYQQEKEYIAIVKDGAGVGRAMLLPAKSSVIGTMQYILPNDCVNIEYLYYVIESMNLAKYYSGATIPHIYFKDYQKEIFKLPNLEEQNKIAKCFNKIVNVIEKRKQQLQKLDELIKARFVEMFGDVEFKKSAFKDCALFIDYRGKTPVVTDEGSIRMVNAKSVGKGVFKYIDEFITEEVYNEWMRRGLGKYGDVLFVTEGHTFGNTCLVPDALKKFALGQRVITIRGQEELLCNEYLCHYMQTDWFVKDINMYKTGGTAQGIRSKDLAKILIPIPPINLQKEFSAFVRQIDKSKLSVQKSLEKLENLKKALMQKYFG